MALSWQGGASGPSVGTASIGSPSRDPPSPTSLGSGGWTTVRDKPPKIFGGEGTSSWGRSGTWSELLSKCSEPASSRSSVGFDIDESNGSSTNDDKWRQWARVSSWQELTSSAVCDEQEDTSSKFATLSVLEHDATRNDEEHTVAQGLSCQWARSSWVIRRKVRSLSSVITDHIDLHIVKSHLGKDWTPNSLSWWRASLGKPCKLVTWACEITQFGMPVSSLFQSFPRAHKISFIQNGMRPGGNSIWIAVNHQGAVPLVYLLLPPQGCNALDVLDAHLCDRPFLAPRCAVSWPQRHRLSLEPPAGGWGWTSSLGCLDWSLANYRPSNRRRWWIGHDWTPSSMTLLNSRASLRSLSDVSERSGSCWWRSR